ncbi:putative ADP-ribosylation factor-like protein 5C isoform X1 [Microtus pennsylvanicus]|uniref:putative ADP-ribosylation factor-like protein 5C isoform X1 n=1 Tax=Microtus pennsylvanicus TaxID=10058 RepID=UPI003F6BBEA0
MVLTRIYVVLHNPTIPVWSTDQKPLRLLSGVAGQAALGPTHTFLFRHQSSDVHQRQFGRQGLSCSELNSATLGVEVRCQELGRDLRTFFCLSSLSNEVVHTCSTIGSNVEEIVLRKTRFLMWDLGGQEALRSSWDTYYSSTEFVILVIDSTDRNRLLTTREELYKMLVHEALQDASVLIFANKQDVKDSMSPAEISQFLTLSAITEHPWHIQGCCALTGEGLPAGLQWMQSQTMTN